MLPVLEIFDSIDGEGLRTGELATFIRLQGCNLHCCFCDTAYSIPEKNKNVKMMSVEEIVKNTHYRNVTLTGGEPLIHNETPKLIMALIEAGHEVNVETNGTMPTGVHLKNLFYTVDYKCIYSGMNDKMNPSAFNELLPTDCVKCVVATIEDMEDALKWYNKFYSVREVQYRPILYFSPVFGKIEPVDIVNWVKGKNLQERVRVQVQLHKIIWDPKMQGV